MNPLLHRLLDELGQALEASGTPGYASLRGAALPFGLAAKLTRTRDRLLIVTPSEEQASKLGTALAALLGEHASPARLPAPDVDPYAGLPIHPALLLDRSVALGKLLQSPKRAVILSADSLLWKVPRAGWFSRHQIVLEEGSTLSPSELRRQLWRLGYRKADLVNAPGEFSVRGGVVDLYPPLEPMPVRLELFGEDIEHLRYFDTGSQRSLSSVGRPVWVSPLTEAIRDEALLDALRKRLDTMGSFGEIRLETLAQIGSYPTMDAEARALGDFFGTLPEFLGPCQTILTDGRGVKEAAQARYRAWTESHQTHGRPSELAPSSLFAEPSLVETLVSQPGVLALGGEDTPPLTAERPPNFPGQPTALLRHLVGQVREGWRVLVLLQGQGTLERFREMAAAEDIVALSEPPHGEGVPGGLYLAVAAAEEGIALPGQRWMVVTEKEIFGRGRPVASTPVRREAFFSNLRDLKIGDAVVHQDHGVGLYQGIETIVREKVREDYMILFYAGGAKLLVPIQRMDLVQKYAGPEGHTPSLDKLGGTGWAKTRDRVHRAVREIAGDLLQLYAKRRTALSKSFGDGSDWQAEFEGQFSFELTLDQQRALEEIRRDLASEKPMDRFVCGDVGFGKTEVAMRAAFQVVADGGQVLVLCPTTVLALQHYERFTERFAPFPFRVAMLSRFVTPQEQKAVLRDVAAGSVDILVGTHRALSKDVNLPNLGLLIVDEEQRFGVTHKEKIKQAKHEVHVLTLTATPIPRTLQMGLSGMLDMSLIQTPPRDRLAIETFVGGYDEEVVAAALRRELAREGQTFYVHNRVESIAACAARLRRLVPDARFTVAHGQMGERALEEVMLSFFHGGADVLVCTTIIENGVDLPRANTLIVEDAQDFGLCQLYQLRGRIGRSNLPSYAYLLTPAGTIATGDAARRLEALQEFAELGAGFRIAAVDLELRGAGTLLGAEQSGHIGSVGFELYIRMLEEAVSELKGEVAAPLRRSEFQLGLDLSVPMEYMEEMNQRLAFYRDLSLASREEEVARIAGETADRFGPLPSAVAGLLDVARLRLRAERAGLRSAVVRGESLQMKFDTDAAVDTRRLLAFLARRSKVRVEPSGAMEVPLQRGESSLRLLDGVLDACLPASGEAR